MSGVRGDVRKRQQGEHLTHWDAGVRAVIEREVAKERERIAQAIEARRVHIHFDRESACEDGCGWLDFAARIAREAGAQ